MVCKRWLVFENFLSDMGERPMGMSIDRFPDSKGNYKPGNARWATLIEQARNKKSSRLTLDLAQEVLGRTEHGEKAKSIARQMKVSVGCIRNVINGINWKELDRSCSSQAPLHVTANASIQRIAR